MSAVRVRGADGDVARLVEQEGLTAARIHATRPPEEGEGSGDRIVTNVPLFPGTFAATGGDDAPGHVYHLAVQCVRWRSEGWAAKASRVVELKEEDRFSEVRRASPWEPGAWPGDSVLDAAHADVKLPPEANPA